MESYLFDVKQMKIPRPKFNTTSGGLRCSPKYPREPPKDYLTHDQSNTKLQHDTEELAQALRDKL